MRNVVSLVNIAMNQDIEPWPVVEVTASCKAGTKGDFSVYWLDMMSYRTEPRNWHLKDPRDARYISHVAARSRHGETSYACLCTSKQQAWYDSPRGFAALFLSSRRTTNVTVNWVRTHRRKSQSASSLRIVSAVHQLFAVSLLRTRSTHLLSKLHTRSPSLRRPVSHMTTKV
jgi:hypothetical protein